MDASCYQAKNHVRGLDWAWGAVVGKLELVCCPYFTEEKGFVQAHSISEVQSGEKNTGQEASHSSHLPRHPQPELCGRHWAKSGLGYSCGSSPQWAHSLAGVTDKQTNSCNSLGSVQQGSSYKMQWQRKDKYLLSRKEWHGRRVRNGSAEMVMPEFGIDT